MCRCLGAATPVLTAEPTPEIRGSVWQPSSGHEQVRLWPKGWDEEYRPFGRTIGQPSAIFWLSPGALGGLIGGQLKMVFNLNI